MKHVSPETYSTFLGTDTHLYNKLKTILRKNADKPKQLETQLKSKRWERLQNCCRGVIFLRTTTKNNYFVRLAGVMMSCAYFITHLPKIELPCFLHRWLLLTCKNITSY